MGSHGGLEAGGSPIKLMNMPQLLYSEYSFSQKLAVCLGVIYTFSELYLLEDETRELIVEIRAGMHPGSPSGRPRKSSVSRQSLPSPPPHKGPGNPALWEPGSRIQNVSHI